MATVVFLLKRFVAQRLLGLAIVVTLGFTIGVLVAGPIYADAAREAITSSAIKTAPVTVKNVRFSVYGGPDFAWGQTDTAIEQASEGLPVGQLVRQGRSETRLELGDVSLSLPLLFRDGAPQHLAGFEGDAPVGAGQVALPEGVARLFDVKAGDTLEAVGPTGTRATLSVTAVFGQPDPADPFWFGTQIPFPSPDSTELPPALLDRAGYLALSRRIGLTTEFAWDEYLDLYGRQFIEVEQVPGRLAGASDELRRLPGLDNLKMTTGLPTLMELVRQRVSNLRVPIFLVVFQIGAVTLAVLAGVGSLVLSRQSFELAVLRSRGFSAGKLIGAQGIQAVLSAVVAYPLGLLLGMALALLASHSNGPSLPGVLFPIRLNTQAEILGIVGAAVGATALLLLSLPHVRRTILEERRLLSREGKPLLARIPVEAFVLPLGIFAFVQLRNSAFQSSLNRDSLDPLVLLSPTLLLFGLSFLALRVLLFTLRRFDRRVGRSRRLPLYLAARRLGRSPGTSFATSLLLVLAVGLLIVSTSYRALVLRNHEDSAHQQVGADWNIAVAAPKQPLSALHQVPANATPVVRTEPAFDVPGQFSITPIAIGIDPTTFATGGWWRPDYSNTPLTTWLQDLEVPPAGDPVNAGRLTVGLTATKQAEGLDLVATVEQQDDTVVAYVLGKVTTGDGVYGATVRAAGRLLSLTLRQEGVGELASSIPVTFRDVALEGTSIDISGWQALRWRGSDAKLTSGEGVEVAIDPGAGHVLGGIAPAAEPLPVLVSPGVASSQSSVFLATIGGQLLTFRQVAVATSFPSAAGDFMVVSGPAILQLEQRVPEAGLSLNEVWAMGPDPRPQLMRAGFILGGVRSAGPIAAVLAQLPQSLAVGLNYAAAAGGLGLVVIGVGVGLYFAQRRREFEFAALRAMGTEPSQITRVLLLEQGLMIVFAVVAGGLLGYGILVVVMPYVGKSLGAVFPPPVLVLDWVSLGVSLVAIGAATAIGLLAALRALLRASVTSVLRGEAE
jgi:putative ABC transport system permease protein